MDIGASVLAKLKNKSQDSGMSFQVQLRLFCQEEFLRRLSLSNYVDNLILKGGLFIGDVIVPKAEKRYIPTQLAGFISPEISTYSLESTIAEKFDAIIERMELSSRMKDYYDIYLIAQTFDFDGRKLQEAIMQTLETRGTSFDRNSFNEIIGFIHNRAMLIKWQQFIKRTKLPDISFSEVINLFDIFLGDIWNIILNEDEWFKKWSCQSLTWHGNN